MPDPYQSAMEGCVYLAAMFTRRANMSVGDLSIQYAAVADNYRKLRKTIYAQAFRHDVPVPYAGGTSYADMGIDAEDSDVVKPWAWVGEDDNKGTAADYSVTSDDALTNYQQ
jgi:hypothetical protein